MRMTAVYPPSAIRVAATDMSPPTSLRVESRSLEGRY